MEGMRFPLFPVTREGKLFFPPFNFSGFKVAADRLLFRLEIFLCFSPRPSHSSFFIKGERARAFSPLGGEKRITLYPPPPHFFQSEFFFSPQRREGKGPAVLPFLFFYERKTFFSPPPHGIGISCENSFLVEGIGEGTNPMPDFSPVSFLFFLKWSFFFMD